MRGQDRQRVGVDDHRQVGVQCEPQRRCADVVGAQSGPTAHACTRPAEAGARRCDDFWPMRKHLLCSTSRIAHHAGCGGHRGAGTQHGRAGIGRGAGQDAGDALAVLVVLGARHGPAGSDVCLVETHDVGCDRSRPMSTNSTRPQSPSA